MVCVPKRPFGCFLWAFTSPKTWVNFHAHIILKINPNICTLNQPSLCGFAREKNKNCVCVCVSACQGANRAVEDAERERREREERLRHSRNPGARGMASASGRARAAQDVAAPSPLNPAAHTGQHALTHTLLKWIEKLKSTNWEGIRFFAGIEFGLWLSQLYHPLTSSFDFVYLSIFQV